MAAPRLRLPCSMNSSTACLSTLHTNMASAIPCAHEAQSKRRRAETLRLVYLPAPPVAVSVAVAAMPPRSVGVGAAVEAWSGAPEAAAPGVTYVTHLLDVLRLGAQRQAVRHRRRGR